MQVDIQDLVQTAGITEPVYPGKKLVKKYQQPGAFKSHCVIFDWLHSKTLRVEIKAGLTGRTPEAADLRQYPVSFQAPTYLDIACEDDEDEKDKEDEEEETKGKSGGGGKKPAKKQLEDSEVSLSAFDKATDGKIPEKGSIDKFVVMGKEIAAEAFEKAFDNLKEQLSQAKIMVMDLMKDVGNVIQKATPGGGLEARGGESIKYKYDAEKTAPMFGGMAPS